MFDDLGGNSRDRRRQFLPEFWPYSVRPWLLRWSARHDLTRKESNADGICKLATGRSSICRPNSGEHRQHLCSAGGVLPRAISRASSARHIVRVGLLPPADLPLRAPGPVDRDQRRPRIARDHWN
ncbi:MAG TPA: hypothetical protein DDZ81_17645 [Acetobacteraceae bacterium]|nr:hypothetical protein [Acetobacteraceae bacterium]